MEYLAAATVLVAGICLVNLAVTLRLARMLGDVRGQLAAATLQGDAGFSGASGQGMFPLGLPVRPCVVTTVDGDRLASDELAPWTLIAVMSPDCSPCHEGLPAFLAAAAQVPGGRDRVLAVLVESDDGAPALVSRLQPAARVVVGADADRLAEALSVGQYPFFVWVGPGGVMEFGGLQVDLSVLPVGAGA